MPSTYPKLPWFVKVIIAEFWPPFYGHKFKITDSIIAVFTALLFIATVLLWWSTRRLVRGADQTAERQLRAYVHVDGINLQTRILAPDRSVEQVITVAWKNFGSTPTRDLKAGISHEIVKAADVATFPFPRNNDTISHALIGPSQSVNVSWTGPVNNEIIIVADEDRDVLLVWGWATYRDVFDKTPVRTTKFAFRVHVVAALLPNVAAATSFESLERHNYAD